MGFERACPRCKSRYPTDVDYCPRDGAALDAPSLDKYLFVRPVFRSQMSEVFEVTHKHTGRRMALKLIDGRLVAHGETADRLRREGRAASAIGDPNIIDITDFGTTDDNSVYLVMEWIDGKTVRDLIDEGPLLMKDALSIAIQCASGLAAAHNIGVIHRDIKPENLMVARQKDGSLKVKILDFGIAKIMHPSEQRLTRTGTVIGTPAYMSPEQARGVGVDLRADIYSLGCVMYELFTGTPPFSATSPMELVFMHASEPVDRPSLRAPQRHLDPRIDALVMRCLAKDPDERVGSMSQLKRELQALEDGGLAPSGSNPEVDFEGARTFLYQGEHSRSVPRSSTGTDGLFSKPAPSQGEALPPPRSRAALWIAILGVGALGLGSLLAWAVTSAVEDDDTKVAASEEANARGSATSIDAGPKLPVATPVSVSTDAAPENEGDAPSEEPEIWIYERTHPKFRIQLEARPVPLQPRAPIELSFSLHDLKDQLSWALTEGRLRAEIEFVHFVSHDTMGEVQGVVDDAGHFQVIFSVPRTGKYHLKVKLKDKGRTVGRSMMDICVGAIPEGPDGASLCPDFNEFVGDHEAAR